MFKRTQTIAVAELTTSDTIVQDREKYKVDFTAIEGDGSIKFEATSTVHRSIRLLGLGIAPDEQIKIIRRKK